MSRPNSGVMLLKSVLLALFATVFLTESPKPAQIGAEHYRVYRGDGTPTTLNELIVESQAAAVTFLGESHDDPVAHYLEEQILRRTWDPDRALSLEMFETDVQYVVDEYLAGLITEAHFTASGRAWRNYSSDYKPLIEFAKENQMHVLAANAPRRYVNRVSRMGTTSLSDLGSDARRFLPPLPYAKASDEYAARFERVMKEQREGGRPQTQESIARGLEAQSLWDASMAYTIASFLTSHPGKSVLHVNGSFHTAARLGTVEHLLRYRPGTPVVVVTILPDKSFPMFDANTMDRQGDFVIVTDPDLPRSYRTDPPAQQQPQGPSGNAK